MSYHTQLCSQTKLEFLSVKTLLSKRFDIFPDTPPVPTRGGLPEEKGKKTLTSTLLTGERPVRKLREGPIAGRVGSQSLPGWGNSGMRARPASRSRRTPARPRPRPALTAVATGCRPEPPHCSATSGHLLEEQGVRGQATQRLPGPPQPHRHSRDSQIPNAAMPQPRGRKWAWPPAATRDAAGKTGSRHLECGSPPRAPPSRVRVRKGGPAAGWVFWGGRNLVPRASRVVRGGRDTCGGVMRGCFLSWAVARLGNLGIAQKRSIQRTSLVRLSAGLLTFVC